MTQGYFISFEGIDGAGKSTAAALLREHLRERGRQVLLTREPGGSRLGLVLRQMLLDDAGLRTAAAEEALLFAADRAAHVREIIAPALAENKIVLCDRYTDSTLAYQGGGRGLDEGFLRQLNSFATAGLQPDLTFYFALPWEVARQRQAANKDRMEQEQAEFFSRVAAVYERLAREEPQRIRSIDAIQAQEDVFAAMLAFLPAEAVMESR